MTDDFSDPSNWHPIEEHPYLNDPPKVTMPDNLRDRIANTLYQELSIELPAAIRGADAVIRELCQEWRIDLGYDGYEFESDRAAAVERLQEIREDWGCDLPPTGVVLQRRYFTEWENDDE